jgi:hypothetical protein
MVAITDLFGGAGDLFQAQGDQTAANLLNQAAQVGQQEETLEGVSGKIQQQAEARQIYMAGGQNVAAAAGGNLATAGSALNLLRNTRQQGALQQQLTGVQTGIQQEGTQMQVLGVEAEAAQAEAAAQAATMGGIGGILGGLFQGAMSLFSDRRLKRSITFVGFVKGIPFYLYKWKWGFAWRFGPIAQEIQILYPEHVRRHWTGFLMVDMKGLLNADD